MAMLFFQGSKPRLLGLEVRSRSLDGLSRPAAGVTRVYRLAYFISRQCRHPGPYLTTLGMSVSNIAILPTGRVTR